MLQLCKAQSCSWFVREMSRRVPIFPSMAQETPWAAHPLWQVSASTLNSKSCLLLWKFRFTLLLFLHTNSEFSSCFFPQCHFPCLVSFICTKLLLQLLSNLSGRTKLPRNFHPSTLFLPGSFQRPRTDSQLVLSAGASSFKQLFVCGFGLSAENWKGL